MGKRRIPGVAKDTDGGAGEKNRNVGQQPPPEAELDEISLGLDGADGPPPPKQRRPEKKTPAIYDVDGDLEPFDQLDTY